MQAVFQCIASLVDVLGGHGTSVAVAASLPGIGVIAVACKGATRVIGPQVIGIVQRLSNIQLPARLHDSLLVPQQHRRTLSLHHRTKVGHFLLFSQEHT